MTRPQTQTQAAQQAYREAITAARSNLDGVTWYAARCRPGREYIAGAELSGQGVPVYFVEGKVYRGMPDKEGRRRRYYKSRCEGYIYIGSRNGIDGLAVVSQCRDILAILGRNGRPVAMPAPDMARHARRGGNGRFLGALGLSAVTASDDIKPGDRARVNIGLLGHSVVIRSIKAGEAEFLADMFGAKVPARVRLSAIERAA